MNDRLYIMDDVFGPVKRCQVCGTCWTDVILHCPHCGSRYFKFVRFIYIDTEDDDPAQVADAAKGGAAE